MKNEKRQTYDNQPYGEQILHLIAQAFPEGHPYHHLPIGSMADLDAASLEDVRSFFRTWYVPSNAHLAVVGDVDVAEALAKVATYFGGIERGEPVPAAPEAGPLLQESRRRDQLVTMVLGGSFGSRLNRKLRERRGVTYGVSAGITRRRDGGELCVGAAVRTDATVESAQEIAAAVALMQQDGPTAAELEEARSTVLGSRAMWLRGAGSVEGAMSGWVAHERPLDFEQRLYERTEQIALEEVRAAAASDLRPKDLLVVVVGDAASFVPQLEAADLGPVEVEPSTS